MKNMRPIPDSPQLFIEIKRLIEAVYTDNTEEFDIFENDIFLLYDPNDEIESDEPEDCEIESNADCEVVDPEIMPPENEYQSLINEAIEASVDDDDFEDDDHDCGDECEDGNPFNVFMPFNKDMFGKHPKGDDQGFFDFLHSDDDDEEDEITPNFVHKPTGLKLWWRIGDDVIYTNQHLKYRALSNIVNQCVASLGRMTESFIVRYQYWGEEGDAKM